MEISRAIDEYLAHLRIEKGASPLTVEAYAADLADYVSFLEEAGVLAVERIDRDTIVAYEADLVERGYAVTSIDRHISVLKGFHKFCLRENFASGNPASTVQLPKPPDKLPDVLTIEQVNELLDQMDDSDDGRLPELDSYGSQSGRVSPSDLGRGNGRSKEEGR